MTDSERLPDEADTAATFDVGESIPNEDGVAITPFVQIAAVMPRNPLEDLALELNRLVKAVAASEANKPSGTVSLTLTVQRSTQTMGAVVITPEVKAKLPKEPKFGALLFADEDGVLSTRDPNQREMFSRPKGVI